ncbi:MAG: IPT/TIG domain-containing protein, partial [Candidatus Eisenbacteria bacterium]|nr:IPT/TIG domain-containing protein [Candidatus Eisenbacteria bacterium]
VGPPQIAQVSPSSLGAQGGVRLTVVGQGFGPPGAFHSVSVQVQQEGSAPVDCGPVRWAGSNTLECRAPAGVEGAADVIVTVNGVAGTMTHAFDYLPASPPSAPVLSGSVPATLNRSGGSLITLTGSNFVSPTENTVVRCGQQLVTPALLTNNLLTFVQPALDEGEDHVPVEVRMGNVNSNPLYNDKGLSGTNPLFGDQASSHSGGTVITITGSDFGPEARVVCSSTTGESHVASPLTVSPTEITFSSPEFATTGDVSVRVDHGAQQSNAQSLPYAGPELTGVSAEEVSPAGGTVITLMGSNFGAAAGRVSFGSDEVAVSSWSPTEIVCAPASRPVGCPSSRPLRVTAEDGSSSRNIPVRWSAPEVLDFDVPAAAAGGGTVITVHGRDFSPHATLEWADGLPGPSLSVVNRSPTSFAVLLGSGSAGGRSLALDGASEPTGVPLPFELLSPPQLSSVSPPSGPIAGGNTITIFGSSFGPPGTKRSVHFSGTDDCPMAVTDEFSDRLTCLVPPGTGSGSRDLVVVVDGVADTLAGAYEYSATAGVPGGASPRATLALAALRSPFASELTLRLTLPQAGRWQLQLFDARGAQVRRLQGDAPAGTFDVRWDGRAADGRAAAPGIYFARLSSAGVTREARAVKLQ